MIKLQQLLDAIFPPHGERIPTNEQQAILAHQDGPAWVLAGPGSGKTEVLALLALRLMYVSEEKFQPAIVEPSSIVITTFTEKAAKNLEDRISRYRAQLIGIYPQLIAIDVSELRVGTLHGLCNDLLQEHRANNYLNVRLMDGFEQAMFVYEHMSIVKAKAADDDTQFWVPFEYLFQKNEWQSGWEHPPSKWLRATALVRLFNRMAEDRVNVQSMKLNSGHWTQLATLYEEYCGHLLDNHRCDFSQLQGLFLGFLGTVAGQSFLDGTVGGRPGMKWLLVDEYQDTNLIQEAIYFEMCKRNGHNLVIVGDDDQAMYRFRGGSVECMVTFDAACKAYYGIEPTSVARYPLAGNFRSHPGIVDFFNEYIDAFPTMQKPGSRIAGKQKMQAKSSISGDHPSVGILEGRTLENLAERFAETVKGLIDNGIVSDPSQCCLLLTSTKETPRNAAPYVDALIDKGLKPYNPRNKAFLQQEEVEGLLGALQAVIDPAGEQIPEKPAALNDFISNCRARYIHLASRNPDLQSYVNACVANIALHPGKYVDTNLQEIIYLLLSCSPFAQWHDDPVRRVRLGRLTALIEAFTSMPVLGQENVQRGRLKVNSEAPFIILPQWTSSFYYLFFGYLARSGMDEVDDDDVICPQGYVPLMTIHQAKGLEFPFVFVGSLSKTASPGDTHRLESDLAAFPGNPSRVFARASANERAELDLIRQFYVAYSRAQYALVLLGTKTQVANVKGTSIPCGPETRWLPQRLLNL